MEADPQQRPRISILLPTHNRADVLTFAIHSVLAQTIRDFELLIVGDGCTDDTAKIVESFADPRIRWFDLPKAAGFGYANRNVALRLARGDYIAYKAHDNLWLSDHLEQLLPFFTDEKVEIVFSRPLLVIPFGMIVPGIFNLNHPPTLEIFLNARCEIPHECVMHRKECFSKYGYWDESIFYGADWDMWKRIIKGGGNFAYSGKVSGLHFKANWHSEAQTGDYYSHWRFNYWMRLFASGQMPPALKLDLRTGVTEQQAIWEIISSAPQQWNRKIRQAVEQVIDMCAVQGTLLSETLLTFNDEVMNKPLPPDPVLGFDFLSLLETFKQMQAQQMSQDATRVALENANQSLENIQNTLTWRIRTYFMNISLLRKLYFMITLPLRRWRSRIK